MSDFTFDDVNSSLAQKSEYLPAFKFYLEKTQNSLGILINNLEAAIDVLSTQYEIIASSLSG